VTEPRWSAPGYELVTRRVAERTGLVFAPSVRRSVEARIREQMAQRSIRALEDYLSALDSDPDVFAALAAALTIGETYFYREPAQLEYLRTRVVPELVSARGPGAQIRAWSAGCAAGEEAYTLAILFRELGLAGSASILGTDLSTERLAVAHRGVYSRWSLRGLPETLEQRYFRRHGNRYHLAPEIRSAARFRTLNLAEDVYPSVASGVWKMDLILCRNVLIYFARETVARVAQRLMSSLGEDGWLFLGASDPSLGELVPCEVVVTGGGIAYRPPRRSVRRTDNRTAPYAPARTPSEGAQPVALPRASRTAATAPEQPAPPAAEDAARAAALYAARDYTAAAGEAARSVQRDGSDVGMWVLLVRALANQGKLEEARHDCLAALKHHRTCAELLYLDGVLLSAEERHADAAAAARRALYVDRGLAVAHLLLGDALRRLGTREEARRALRNAERLLAALPAGQVVPASDGEPAGRLLRLARVKLRLAEEAA
jgi:chemotaxis protein methyltransferase CheR